METTETIYYVVMEGASEEEGHTWDDIERLCRAGKYTPDTRIYFPDENRWARAGDTDLKLLFEAEAPAQGNAAATVDVDAVALGEEEAAEREALEAEYHEALGQVDRQPDSPDARVDAGRLAFDLGDREGGREHFQRALDLSPFNSRIAKEVTRRFSKVECKGFQYLHRDPPPWDDLAALMYYPLSVGPLYVVVPAAVLFVLSYLPPGVYVAGPLVFLWLLQIERHTAMGSMTPPKWEGALSNPVREIIVPLVAGGLVAAQCALVVYGVGRAATAVDGGGRSAFDYIAASPVLSVALLLVALAYLPAVLTRMVHSAGDPVQLLNPHSVVRSIARMGQEYAISALAMVVMVAELGFIRLVLGGVPLVGHLLFAAAVAVLIPVAGLVLGRLAGRMRHVL